MWWAFFCWRLEWRAISSVLTQALEDHVREQLMGDDGISRAARRDAADELIQVIHAYLK